MAQLEPMVDAATAAHQKKRPVNILDVGGGQGHLAAAIAKRFGSRVHVRVLDVSAAAIHSGRVRAQRGKIPNLEFALGDASVVDCAGVDIVVSLHGCGICNIFAYLVL